MPHTVEEELSAIEELDALDTERWAAERELAATPAQLAEETAAVAAVDAERERLTAELAAARAAVREGERELAVIQKRAKRAQDRMPYLTSSDQIEATQREIAARAEEADELEMTILEGMEGVDELEASLKQTTAQLDQLRATLAERTAAWEARKPGLDADVARLAAARAEVIAPLSSELQRLYRAGVKASASSRRDPGGATRVDGTTCQTCWAEVPARWVNETIARKQIYSCQTCKRIVLASAPVDDPEPA